MSGHFRIHCKHYVGDLLLTLPYSIWTSLLWSFIALFLDISKCFVVFFFLLFLFYNCVVIGFNVRVFVCVKSLKLSTNFRGKISALGKKGWRGRERFQGNLLHVEGCCIDKCPVLPLGRQCHTQAMYPGVSLAEDGSCPHSQEESWRNRQRFSLKALGWSTVCMGSARVRRQQGNKRNLHEKERGLEERYNLYRKVQL